MTHLAVHEWGKVTIGAGGFTRAEANRLAAAARLHQLGGDEGAQIISDHHAYLRVRQCVGILGAADCSLEILPKVDPEAPNPEKPSVRAQLIRMLDAALELEVSEGEFAPLARQSATLLDILIRIFADKLLAQTRQGLPRAYRPVDDDLRALRGQLDVTRQFTFSAVRPDRLACRFDELSVDTPLMQVMRACVVFLAKRAKIAETERRLTELRTRTEGVVDVPVHALPWHSIRLDRTSHGWMALVRMARLFLTRQWEATHQDVQRPQDGISLLFPMDELFETITAKAIRKALAPLGFEIVSQGGFRNCLGAWAENEVCTGTLFRTKPDIIIRARGRNVAILDTKWKCLRNSADERKRGISQDDVYQLMAYSQLYECDRLMLIYPHHAALPHEGFQGQYGIAVPGRRPPPLLQIVTINVAADFATMAASIYPLIRGLGVAY